MYEQKTKPKISKKHNSRVGAKVQRLQNPIFYYNPIINTLLYVYKI